MSAQLSDFLRRLSGTLAIRGADDRAEMLLTARAILDAADTLTPDNRALLIDTAEKGARRADRDTQILALSFAATLSGDGPLWRRAVESMLEAPAPLAVLNADFNSLLAVDFNRTPPFAGHIRRSDLKALYERRLTLMRAALPRPAQKPPHSGPPRALITVSQMLPPPHAPSVDALRYAGLLQGQHGFDTLIVNSGDFSPAPAGRLLPVALKAHHAAYSTVTGLSFEGRTHAFYQSPAGPFDETMLAALTARIAAFAPDMIVAIGDSEAVAELYAHDVFVFRHPTTAGVPLVSASMFHLWKPPDTRVQQLLETEDLTAQLLFCQHPGFVPPPTGAALSRAALGLNPDAFVITLMGLRLSDELDDLMLALLDRLVAAYPHVEIAFAGLYPRLERRVAVWPALARAARFTGFQADVSAFFACCDLMINPPRTGAGSTVVYALAAGLPVLSLPVGDGGLAAACLPPLGDLAALEAGAEALIRDPSHLADYRRRAREGVAPLLGCEAFVDAIVREFTRSKSA